MARRRTIRYAVIVGVVALGVCLFGYLGWELNVPSANAAGGVVSDPDGTAPGRYIYYPGTEALGG